MDERKLAALDYDEGVEDRFFFDLAFGSIFMATSLCSASLEKSFHFRQPSKSIRACMQPHSMTFRSR